MKKEEYTVTKLNGFSVNKILNEMANEIEDKTYNLFFTIKNNKVFIYSTTPGVWIGRAGTRINKYIKMLKDIGAKKVSIVELRDGRLPDYSNWTKEDWDNL